MSHAATKWAFDQPELHRDMKPSEWAVLMVLADCHNPVNGCFPSQDYICSKTNLGERAVRDQLANLRERGLIAWDAAREGQRRGSNRYRLGFEADFQPAKSAGREEAAPTGENAPSQPAESDALNRQNLPPNLVREPVKEPEEREAREDDQEKPEGQSKRAEALFYRSFTVWDRFAVSPKPPMLDAWGKLTWSQMQAAADAVPRYLAACRAAGVKHAPAISTFLDLAEKMWEAFPPEPEKPQPPYAPAFGPVWAAIRMRDLITGPKVAPSPLKGWEERAVAEGRLDREALEKGNLMRSGWPMVNALHMAAETRGLGIHDFGPEEAELGKLCEFVPVGSPVWEAWKAEHERRGWPWLPDPGSMRGVYFPVGGPDGLEAFEQALRGNHDAGGREAAE